MHCTISRILSLALALVGMDVGTANVRAADDAVLTFVQEHPYREEAIRLLEDKLREDSTRLDYWTVLIRGLDANEPQFAERAASMALKQFPNHPDLLIARAQALPDPAAWDQLDDLEQLPGERDRARWLKDLLKVHALDSYGDGRPKPWQARLQASWAREFLSYGVFDRVSETVREGLKSDPDEKTLTSLLPFALALDKRFDQALAEHARQGCPQKAEGCFICLADCLLYMDQPRAAIASLHGETPEDQNQRRVLALAHAAVGEYDRADELLADKAVDALLRLRWDLKRDREQDVRQRVPELLGRYCTGSIGSWAPPTYAGNMGSLSPEYRAAIAWLYEEFPDDSDAIYFAFGSINPDQRWFDRWKPDEDVRRSARRYVTWLENAIPEAKGRDLSEMRRRLSRLLASQQQYAAAADVLAPNAVPPAEDTPPEDPDMSRDAVTWSILRRRVETRKLHESDPWSLVTVRRLLNEIQKWRTWDPGEREPMKPADVVAELLKLPPGILAPVMDDLEPEVVSATDRAAYVAIIRERGGLEDTPVLISTLWRTVRDESDSNGLSPDQIDNDRRSADALHECLEHLTGVDGPGGSTRERSRFWVAWWLDHSRAIVLGE